MKYKFAMALFNGLNRTWKVIDDFFFWLTEKIWDHIKDIPRPDKRGN
jgi:hypothetical protein